MPGRYPTWGSTLRPITKKIVLALSVALLLLVTGLAGTLLYFYHHPASLKPFIENTVSRAGGAAFTIDDLSYSLKPLQIRAEGIRLIPGERLKGISLHIPVLIADMAREGPFNRKRLIFKVLKVKGFSIDVSGDLRLPEFIPGERHASWISKVLGRLFAFLVFREVEFQSAEVSDGHISGRLADQALDISSIRASLTPERLLEIACGVRFDWPSRETLLFAPNLRFTSDRAHSLVDPEIKGRVAFEGGVLRSPSLEIPAMDGKAQLVFRRDLKRLTFTPFELALKGVNTKEGFLEPLSHLDLSLKATGHFDLQGLGARISSFHLTLGDIMDARGRLQARIKGVPGVDLDLLTCRLVPEKLLPLLPPEVREPLNSWTLSGPVSLEGKVRAVMAEGGPNLDCDIRTRLDKTPFFFAKDGRHLNGEVSADLKISGGIPDVTVRGKVVTANTLFSANGITTGPMRTNFGLTYKKPLIRINDLETLVPQANFAIGGEQAVLRDIRFRTLQGTFDLNKRDLDLPKATLDTSLLKNIEMSLHLDRTKTSATLMGKESHLIETARTFGLLPPGWRFQGSDTLDVRVVQGPNGDWSIEGKLAVQHLNLENRDATCMGEGISMRVRIESTVTRDLSRIEAKASLGADAGEILFGRYYFNLSENGFYTDGEGTLDFSRQTLELPRLTVSSRNLLSLSLKGMLARAPEGGQALIRLHIPRTPVKPLFRHFLLEPFKMEKPLLTTLNVGGLLSSDLHLSLNGAHRTAKGHLRWEAGRLASGERGFSFRGIDLRFPVWSGSMGMKIPDMPLKGALSVGSIDLPILPEQSLALELQAVPDNLMIKDATFIKVPGGEIEIGPLSCTGLYASDPSIETSLSFESVDLDPLLSQVWARPISGIAHGKLAPIVLKGDRLKTRGEVRADVFGGKVTVSELEASGILTSTPIFRLNANWKDLSLKDLTTDTAFGKVDGILTGYLRNLQIAYGQPQRFQLLLETVKTKGVPQRISVKAVDNIARIGGGQSPFMGVAGMFTSFFREFPYKKIGVKASLENDVFRINGTIKEGETEYLVKRGSFSGVNVVNQDPDNRISFKDMVKIIKRVIASQGGPVIE